MKIIVDGKPIAKKRPRFARRGKINAVINDQETEEGRFLLLAREQITERLDGPVFVAMRFFMHRPKKHYGTGRNAGVLKPSAPAYHTIAPDVDNMEKFAADCLNGTAWADDSQIVMSHTSKHYADDGEPRTEIEILPADDFI